MPALKLLPGLWLPDLCTGFAWPVRDALPGVIEHNATAIPVASSSNAGDYGMACLLGIPAAGSK